MRRTINSLIATLGTIIFLVGATPAIGDMLGHGGMVRAIAVSPDGRQVLSGSFDYTARVWDFEEQKSVAVLEDHFGPINGVWFSA